MRVKSLFFSILVVLAASLAIESASASADFGVKDFDVTFTNQDGTPDTQAGSHPFAMVTSLHFNAKPTVEGGEELDSAAKDIIVSQTLGLVGDQTTIPQCKQADFLKLVMIDEGMAGKSSVPACPDSTAIGTVAVKLANSQTSDELYASVYNLESSPGVAVKIGFRITQVPVEIELGVSETAPYRIVGGPTNISQILEFTAARLTIWGVPADHAHDSLRGHCFSPFRGISLGSCPASVTENPFLTLPGTCGGPLETLWATDSWVHPAMKLNSWQADLSDGNWLTGSVLTHDNSEPPVSQGMTGCGRLGFDPSLTTAPTTKAAASPTGFDVGLNINDEGLKNPLGIADSDLKKAVVRLPEGMTANPSLAPGLGVCTEEELARERAASLDGAGCPDSSKIGTTEVETPLLSAPLRGSLYIAKPYANPFGSLLALYFVIKNPQFGINIVQPAEVIPDPVTGRLVTIVENIPQFPFSHFRLHFREGARSPLVSPPGCGTYSASAELTPWSGTAPVSTNSTFQIITGPDEGPCPVSGTPPFSPQAVSGTIDNSAAAYSPLYLQITRRDGEQELTRFTTNLPPGLTGNLSGIPFCPDAAIEAARHRTGTQENAQPSCPPASLIGHTEVGAGVGGTLAYAPGKIYLAGPYHGSALSVLSITSATVGPFDLGTVVIRFALRINPITAQVEIDSNGSDPIPHIIKGIVVHVRTINVYVDRERFILNPTSCNPLAITNTITGAGQDIANPLDDTTANTNDRFQAADCANLAFKPSFKVSATGKNSRKNGAGLNVKLTYPKTPEGTQTNIRSVKVDLPKQLPSRLTTLQKACTAAQFETNPAGCPVASIVGHATAITPILPVPITGPAYFVSHGGAKFPELVIVLQGYGITIDLHGETFINEHTSITSSTFHTVPDQPVTSFELTLPQGPNSALAANGNLCTTKLKMPTLFTGQNGAVVKQSTLITVTGCPKIKPKKKGKKAHNAKRHHSHTKKK